MRLPREEPGAGFVLRGTQRSGRVCWILTALAPVDAWRVVHLEVPGPGSGVGPGRTALAALLDQLEGIAPEAGPAIREVRDHVAARGDDDTSPDAVAELLTRHVAAEPPLLVLVDAAQHLRDVTLDAIATICRRADPGALAMVLGVPGRVDPRIRALGLPLVDATTLGADALAALVQRRFGRRLAPAVAAEVLQHTEDDPSASVEVVEQLDDAQLAGWTALPLPLPAVAAGSPVLDRLARPTRAALLLAALAHTPDPRVLARALELADLPPDALGQAEEHGVVRVGDREVAFVRPLDRSAAVAGAPPAERRSAHARLAEAFDSVATHELAARVHHLAASRTVPAADLEPLLRRLAEQEVAAGRPLQAARAWAALGESLVDPDRRQEALARAAVLARAAGRSAWGDQLVPMAAAAGPRHVPAQTDGPLRVAHELEAGGELLVPDEPTRAARLLATAAVTSLLAGELGEAERVADLAADLAAEVGPVESAWVGTARCVVEVLTARGAGTGSRLRAHLAAFPPAQEDPDASLLRAAGHLGRVWLGDVDGARVDLRSLVAELDTAGHTGHLPFALACLAAADHRRGWWDVATEHAHRARELAASTDQPMIAGYATIVLATIAAARGQEADCRALLEEITTIATASGTEPMLQYAAAAEGLLELGLGAPQVAAARLEEADAEARRRGVRRSTVLGLAGDLLLAEVEAGDTQRAADVLRRLQAEQERAPTPWVGAMVLRGEALLGPPADAVPRLAASADLLHAVIDPFEQARNQLLCADVRLRLGQVAAARAEARLARTTFASLRAEPWVARAVRIEEALDRSGGAARLLDDLTPQERRVARLVADGGTNREVAAELSLSPKTIEYHLHNVYQKTGVASRAELVRLTLQADGDGRAP